MTGVCPASLSRLTVCDPMYPAPPATSTFMPPKVGGRTLLGRAHGVACVNGSRPHLTATSVPDRRIRTALRRFVLPPDRR